MFPELNHRGHRGAQSSARTWPLRHSHALVRR
jgi:hypothetical protein